MDNASLKATFNRLSLPGLIDSLRQERIDYYGRQLNILEILSFEQKRAMQMPAASQVDYYNQSNFDERVLPVIQALEKLFENAPDIDARDATLSSLGKAPSIVDFFLKNHWNASENSASKIPSAPPPEQSALEERKQNCTNIAIGLNRAKIILEVICDKLSISMQTGSSRT